MIERDNNKEERQIQLNMKIFDSPDQLHITETHITIHD